MAKLMIVESPTKAKKIQGYLGDGWIVKASFGHVRDLPDREMGVDLGTFQPQYVVNVKSKKTLSNLKALCQNADQVYLATDPDREGEAISWHLQQALFLNNPKRITFNDVSKKALEQALAKARQIDFNLVRAQECRRVLDRLVGYTVSPALSNAMGKNLSAGRVQSVALRLVVERELEIQNFKPTAYVEVYLAFETNDIQWRAQWVPPVDWLQGQKIWTDRQIATDVARLREVDVTAVEVKRRHRRPPAPFITSTLQQAASAALKMSPKKSMDLAQQLFEDGWISYHRTDNPNLSAESAQDVMTWLHASGYGDHVADKVNTWKAKDGAQQGHEAIRVTDLNQMPDIAKARLTDEQYQLYTLIWLRTVGCQMKDAQFDVTQVTLKSKTPVNDRLMDFVAKGQVLIYPGWMKLIGADPLDDDDEETQTLPPLKPNQVLMATDAAVMDKKTKPSPRFTESSLVKKLEDEGIGRPATYAAIIHNIIEVRGYIEIKKRMLHATDIGMAVCSMLSGKFQFMELGYTREVETRLDGIAEGNAEYAKVIGDVYFRLRKEMAVLDGASAPATLLQDSATTHSCPKCDKPLRLIKGEFWGCTGYPGCKFTAPNMDRKPQFRSDTDSSNSQYPCECGHGHLKMLPGKKGPFWGCTAYPNCKITLPNDGGKPGQFKDRPSTNSNQKVKSKSAVVTGDQTCPACASGHLVNRTVKAGKNQGKPFIGCSNYPNCNHFAWS